jgi:hypothetical protein
VSDSFDEDVSDAGREMVNQAVHIRGSIITSYAHIEFLLADICVKAWRRSEYASLATAFPYKTDTRIKAVRKLFDVDGPLKTYSSGIQPVLDELLNFEELRHFVAHGLLIVTPMRGPGGAKLEYRLYRTTKDGAKIDFLERSASELTDTSIRISELLHDMLTTFRQIYFDLQLEFE